MEPRPTAERFVGLVPGFPGAGGAHGAAVRRCLAGGAGRPAPIAHGAVVVILGLPLPSLGTPSRGTPSRAAVAAAAALRSASLTASASASKRGRSATVSLASSSPASPIARPFCVAGERCLMSRQLCSNNDPVTGTRGCQAVSGRSTSVPFVGGSYQYWRRWRRGHYARRRGAANVPSGRTHRPRDRSRLCDRLGSSKVCRRLWGRCPPTPGIAKS